MSDYDNEKQLIEMLVSATSYMESQVDQRRKDTAYLHMKLHDVVRSLYQVCDLLSNEYTGHIPLTSNPEDIHQLVSTIVDLADTARRCALDVASQDTDVGVEDIRQIATDALEIDDTCVHSNTAVGQVSFLAEKYKRLRAEVTSLRNVLRALHDGLGPMDETTVKQFVYSYTAMRDQLAKSPYDCLWRIRSKLLTALGDPDSSDTTERLLDRYLAAHG